MLSKSYSSIRPITTELNKGTRTNKDSKRLKGITTLSKGTDTSRAIYMSPQKVWKFKGLLLCIHFKLHGKAPGME